MIAIKNDHFDMVKYLLFSTVAKKYLKQLDFNNGKGDIPEDTTDPIIL